MNCLSTIHLASTEAYGGACASPTAGTPVAPYRLASLTRGSNLQHDHLVQSLAQKTSPGSKQDGPRPSVPQNHVQPPENPTSPDASGNASLLNEGPIPSANSVYGGVFPKTVPLPGSLHTVSVRCGRPRCHCASGTLHGPYFVRRWREGGQQRSQYVPKQELHAVRTAIHRWRAQHPPAWSMRRLLTELRALGSRAAG